MTAVQLAEESGSKLRTAQTILVELLGDHGKLGVMTRLQLRPYSPGRQSWVYFLKR